VRSRSRQPVTLSAIVKPVSAANSATAPSVATSLILSASRATNTAIANRNRNTAGGHSRRVRGSSVVAVKASVVGPYNRSQIELRVRDSCGQHHRDQGLPDA
jgi:hypothetical protein